MATATTATATVVIEFVAIMAVAVALAVVEVALAVMFLTKLSKIIQLGPPRAGVSQLRPQEYGETDAKNRDMDFANHRNSPSTMNLMPDAPRRHKRDAAIVLDSLPSVKAKSAQLLVFFGAGWRREDAARKPARMSRRMNAALTPTHAR